MSDLVFQFAAGAQPWFENQGLVGSVLGGGVGALGALYGTTLGVCAPGGRAKGFVFGLHWTCLSLGVVLLAAGMTALVSDQPYGVWYPLLLAGGLLTVLMGIFTPMIRMLYRRAEHRRLEAEEFRRG